MNRPGDLDPLAILECKICWTPYDPAAGDDTRQILPGTPFHALPEDWTCPTCAAPRHHFIVQKELLPARQELAARTAQLATAFEQVWLSSMRDMPLINPALHVEAVGFRCYGARPLGVLITPWFMNLVQLPVPAQEWSGLAQGASEIVAFPSGDYEFLYNRRDPVGDYRACSLFSPMNDFTSQAQARDVAYAVTVALLDPANRDETNRAADIRAAHEKASP